MLRMLLDLGATATTPSAMPCGPRARSRTSRTWSSPTPSRGGDSVPRGPCEPLDPAEGRRSRPSSRAPAWTWPIPSCTSPRTRGGRVPRGAPRPLPRGHGRPRGAPRAEQGRVAEAVEAAGEIPDSPDIDLSLFPVAHTQWMWGQPRPSSSASAPPRRARQGRRKNDVQGAADLTEHERRWAPPPST